MCMCMQLAEQQAVIVEHGQLKQAKWENAECKYDGYLVLARSFRSAETADC